MQRRCSIQARNILAAFIAARYSIVSTTRVHVHGNVIRRKMCSHLLQSLSYVDLNARSLDGKLPEEMTEDKAIIKMIHKARSNEPNRYAT